MESFLLSWCERTQLLTAAVMVRWCWQRWCFRFRYSCISRLKIDLRIDRKPPQKWADLEGVLILFSKSILRWDGQDQNRLQNRLKYLLTERALLILYSVLLLVAITGWQVEPCRMQTNAKTTLLCCTGLRHYQDQNISIKGLPSTAIQSCIIEVSGWSNQTEQPIDVSIHWLRITAEQQ